MKKCPRCGHEVNNNEKYCPHCGLDLQERYRAIKPKNKAMTYLLYVIIFFSFITIPLFYSRLLNAIDNDVTQLNEEKIELPKIEDTQPTSILAVYDTLADFQKQFTNVNTIVDAISQYEASLTQRGDYTFDKTYHLVILNNYDIYYTLTYTTQINENLSVTIQRQYDRSHTYNTEEITFKHTGATTFNELFLNEEELKIVKTFTGKQKITDELIADFSKRQDEFDTKKKTLGHYGLGNYNGRSSFVAHRQGESYYSELVYNHEVKDYIH